MVKAGTFLTETLSQAKKGQFFSVVAFTEGLGELKRRLEAIGMTPGSWLSVLQTKGNGTLIVQLRSCKWALGKDVTAHIVVQKMSEEEFRQKENERL